MIQSNNDTNDQSVHGNNLNNDSGEMKRPNKRKQTFERRNIRNIIDDQKFGKVALEAQHAEIERLKRVQVKEKLIKCQNITPEDERYRLNQSLQSSEKSESYPNNFVKIYPALQPKHKNLYPGCNISEVPRKQCRIVHDSDVINLDDSDDEPNIAHQKEPKNKFEVIEISDGDDSDDNIEDTIDQEQADKLNFNHDENGNILINVLHTKDDADFFLRGKISKSIKPHQVSGIRFLYENLVESRKQFKESRGFGCILAHSMGLGKTIQVIGFLDILFRCCDARSTLVIVPINTLQNWQAEVDNWLPVNDKQDSEEVNTGRSFALFVIKDCHKTIESRHSVIKEWRTKGGVLLIGYEMFRLLVTYRQNKSSANKYKKNKLDSIQSRRKVVKNVELESRRIHIYQDFYEALVNPGPEVIICDEGHRIKNSEASISKALKSVKTRRRIVLTGYPLQNNLTEYWCMVDFVRPNYLGSKHEFHNMFQRPIENGQCVDSTVEDRKLMQGRAHVLHELLLGFVQRRSHAVLKANLPPKWEYVIMVRLSPIQKRLYSDFMYQLASGSLCSWSHKSTLRIYAMCCKIWNHPDILFRVIQEKFMSKSDPDFDFDIDEDLNVVVKTPSLINSVKSRSKKAVTNISENSWNHTELESSNSSFSLLRDNEELPMSTNHINTPSVSYSAYLEMLTRKAAVDDDNPYAWINDASWTLDDGQDYYSGSKEHSGKITIFLSLLEECISFGDKMLLFSQSLLTLDVIELFLKKTKLTDDSVWDKNKTYFRLDGSTSASERERMINAFNEPNSPADLFLLSTRAGCLGINLIGANRVVVFDASWNPCHDCQAVCRVYRYGQRKPCFIYRLVSDNTMERKIYDRQVNKQGISDRVVDESNPGQHFLRSQVQVLAGYQENNIPKLTSNDIKKIKEGCGDEDPILGRILEKHSEWVTRVPFTHESLLIDRKDYRLTKGEKRHAKEAYEKAKRQSQYYQNGLAAEIKMPPLVHLNNDFNPQRFPQQQYRSSIIPRMQSSSHMNPNLQNYYNPNQYNAELPLSRPLRVPMPNSAFMRQVVDNGNHFAFENNTDTYPIVLSEDDDDVVIVTKKPRDYSNSDMNTANSSETQMIDNYPTTSELPEPDPVQTNQLDKSFKVFQITATTEINIPASPTVTTSHAHPTKVLNGEPLEVIYTANGKFLRVPRTGDLFAIKDDDHESATPPPCTHNLISSPVVNDSGWDGHYPPNDTFQQDFSNRSAFPNDLSSKISAEYFDFPTL